MSLFIKSRQKDCKNLELKETMNLLDMLYQKVYHLII
jgi:hypothetical protein